MSVPFRRETFRLSNGLTIVLAPIPASPTASVWVWYRVGSRNEWPGITGASHWVEHMLFQGSPRYPKGAIDRAVVEVGGSLNAFTDTDFTAYFTTVPRDRVDVPIDFEADRMTRTLFLPKEVERERTVIHSEREGNENWPEFRCEEELYSIAFKVHPYRWDTLGFKADIVGLTADGLASYYRRFYGTRNATLVVAGGFSPKEMRADLTRRFGSLAPGGDDPRVTLVEPPSTGERRSMLRGPGTTPLLSLGWRAPAVHDPRTPATILVDAILGGETRLFSAGGGWWRGHEHPSARLYRELIDTGLAVRASSEWRPRQDPGLFTIRAQAAPGIGLDRLEPAIDAVVDRFVREGPTKRELDDARTRIRRGYELAYEGASGAGFRLGFFATLGEPSFERRLVRRILAVERAGVRAEAERLFQARSRSVVAFEPEGGADAAN